MRQKGFGEVLVFLVVLVGLVGGIYYFAQQKGMISAPSPTPILIPTPLPSPTPTPKPGVPTSWKYHKALLSKYNLTASMWLPPEFSLVASENDDNPQFVIESNNETWYYDTSFQNGFGGVSNNYKEGENAWQWYKENRLASMETVLDTKTRTIYAGDNYYEITKESLNPGNSTEFIVTTFIYSKSGVVNMFSIFRESSKAVLPNNIRTILSTLEVSLE